ncbi:Uncharacterized protein FWK35_00022740 [Aphis craccivora]|uniref:Uncharacterized protein n=1 Tax=Aphis craccivora TaxID=307492 RepID=A0A6G0XZ95_APHCR|nr:Uncharacterized protein FWK35_00022740 [Aphis craccivora]
MVPGHSRMEYPTSINHPYDWSQLIRWAGKEKFKVEEMDQSNFYYIKSLLKTKDGLSAEQPRCGKPRFFVTLPNGKKWLTDERAERKKKRNDGADVNTGADDRAHLRRAPVTVTGSIANIAATGAQCSRTWLDLSGTKINTRKTINDVILPIAYNDTLLITNEKKIDLLTLLPLIPEKDVTDPLISDEELD